MGYYVSIESSTFTLEPKHYDDALFYIILTYLLNNQLDEAQDFLNKNINNFITEEKLKESKKIIMDSKKNNKIKYFFKLIK